jgi:hypothetical protein
MRRSAESIGEASSENPLMTRSSTSEDQCGGPEMAVADKSVGNCITEVPVQARSWRGI